MPDTAAHMGIHEREPEPGSTLEVHFKLFGSDGVSLQSQELADELRRRSWRVHSCASDVPAGNEGLRLPELSYQSEDALALRSRLFKPASEYPLSETSTEEGTVLFAEIRERAIPIKQQVEEYLKKNNIHLIHIRNIMALPYNLPATLAFYELAKEHPDIGFIMHHHDIYWEGPNAKNFHTPHKEIAELMNQIICPDLPNATHTLINPIAAEALEERKGIKGVVIPDGFNFDRQVKHIDEQKFRRELDILVGEKKPVTENDLVVAMPARVAINKAIELAIQFTAGLEEKRAQLENAPDGVGRNKRKFTRDSRIVLLLPQGEDLNESIAYFDKLLVYARHVGITLAYGGSIVVPDRKYTGDEEHYPFYSTYQAVDFVSYTPEHEGFGNQAIETVWAKLPLAILEYPVFKRFVRKHIPHYVSLGDVESLGTVEQFGGFHLLGQDILDQATNQAISILTDHEREKQETQENVVRLRQFCGIEHVAARYIQLYDEARRRTE